MLLDPGHTLGAEPRERERSASRASAMSSLLAILARTVLLSRDVGAV